jgi:hypothetical protein
MMDANQNKPDSVIESTETEVDKVAIFKKRMLTWDSPVEYVNNMYGSHANDSDGSEYFKEIYAKCTDLKQ